ncbi:nucleoside-diphosphate kinase, partial [Bacillus pumilus]
IIHGSDSPESAEREINLFFKQEELTNWDQTISSWIY